MNYNDENPPIDAELLPHSSQRQQQRREHITQLAGAADNDLENIVTNDEPIEEESVHAAYFMLLGDIVTKQPPFYVASSLEQLQEIAQEDYSSQQWTVTEYREPFDVLNKTYTKDILSTNWVNKVQEYRNELNFALEDSTDKEFLRSAVAMNSYRMIADIPLPQIRIIHANPDNHCLFNSIVMSMHLAAGTQPFPLNNEIRTQSKLLRQAIAKYIWEYRHTVFPHSGIAFEQMISEATMIELESLLNKIPAKLVSGQFFNPTSFDTAYLQEHWDTTLDMVAKYALLIGQQDIAAWGGPIEIMAAAHLLQRNIFAFVPRENRYCPFYHAVVNQIDNEQIPIVLCYQPAVHYDVLWPIHFSYQPTDLPVYDKIRPDMERKFEYNRYKIELENQITGSQYILEAMKIDETIASLLPADHQQPFPSMLVSSKPKPTPKPVAGIKKRKQLSSELSIEYPTETIGDRSYLRLHDYYYDIRLVERVEGWTSKLKLFLQLPTREPIDIQKLEFEEVFMPLSLCHPENQQRVHDAIQKRLLLNEYTAAQLRSKQPSTKVDALFEVVEWSPESNVPVDERNVVDLNQWSLDQYESPRQKNQFYALMHSPLRETALTYWTRNVKKRKELKTGLETLGAQEHQDAQVYALLDKHREQLFSKEQGVKRAERRITDVAKMMTFSQWQSMTKDNTLTVVDYGGAEGNLSHALKNKLPHLAASRNISIDLEHGESTTVSRLKETTNQPFEDVTYIRVQPLNEGEAPKYIDLPDSSVTMVTAMQLLHHVTDLNHVLTDIYRMLKPGGFFIVREHDHNSSLLSTLIDMEHGAYESPENREEWFKTYSAFYKSFTEWKSIITSHGFIYQELGKKYPHKLDDKSVSEFNQTRTGYMLFTKENRKETIEKAPAVKQITIAASSLEEEGVVPTTKKTIKIKPTMENDPFLSEQSAGYQPPKRKFKFYRRAKKAVPV